MCGCGCGVVWQGVVNQYPATNRHPSAKETPDVSVKNVPSVATSIRVRLTDGEAKPISKVTEAASACG